MTIERLTLRAGTLEVEVAPALGGSLVRFDRHSGAGIQPLFRPLADGRGSVLDAACFPLVPFANRIRGGRFVCDGREIRLAPNMAGDPSPLHGQGWLSRWTVESSSAHSANLLFRHETGAWPWSYEARQQIALDADGLSITLSCRNLSSERMPCGLGLHPYHPCDAGTILDTEVASAWTIDADVLPVENVPATGRYDLQNRNVCGQSLDNGFDGWSGSARIDWPGRPASLVLSSPDAGRFQLYSPAGGELFVAEPVQNANAALNEDQESWEALGIAMLDQGGECRLHARFTVVSFARF